MPKHWTIAEKIERAVRSVPAPRASGIDPDTVPTKQRLTPRQRAFAHALWRGASAAEAYDQAFSTQNMPRDAVWRDACALIRHPWVNGRLRELRGHSTALAVVEARGMRDEHERRRELVLSELERAALDPQAPHAAKIKALELLGKVRGTDLFSDRVEQVKGDLTREQVEQQLKERLERLRPKPQHRQPLALPPPSQDVIVADKQAEPSEPDAS